MSHRKHFGRRLRVESLEARRMLAGDVTVKVSGGNLLITGDNKDNYVVVSGTGTSGQYVVEGLSDSNGIATNLKYNNTNNSSVVVNGISALIVDLENGNNGFGLTNAMLKGSVNISTGSGNDLVAIGDVSGLEVSALIVPLQVPTTGAVCIGGNLNIQTNAGNDVVDIGTATSIISSSLIVAPKVVTHAVTSTGVTVSGNVNIDTGAGDDSVNIGTGEIVLTENALVAPKVLLATPGVFVGGDLNINTEAGNDNVNEAGLSVMGSQNLDVGSGTNNIDLFDAGGEIVGGEATGQGVNVKNNFNIHSGTGNDTYDVYDLVVGNTLNVVDDGGTNMFDFSLAQIGSDANFTLAGKCNTLEFGQDDGLGEVSTPRFMVGRDLNITATASNMTSVVESSTHVGRNETVLFGSGNDSLAIDTTTVVGTLYADGGKGTNTLLLGPGNFFGKSTFKNFH